MNKVSKFLNILLCVNIIFLAVGCKRVDAHEHTFEENWTFDEYSHFHAATCGHEVKADEAAHTYGEWTIVKPATEEQEGSREHTCTVCGYKATGTINKLPHTHTYATEWTSNKNFHWHQAACSHTNLTTKKEAHTFGEWAVTTQPTEQSQGQKTRSCTVCGFEETMPVTQLKHTHTYETEWKNNQTEHWHEATCGHNLKSNVEKHKWDNGTILKAETCTTPGQVKYTCKVCKATKTEEIPADHKWDNGEITVQATCTTDGEKTFTCKRCNKKDKVVIQATGHSYNTEWTKNQTHHWHQATCEHTTLKSNYAEHSWGPVDHTVPVTCTTDGLNTYTCIVCGQTKTVTVPATGHTFSTIWRGNNTKHWHEATCGHDVKSDEAEHIWDSGTVVQESTVMVPGRKRFECTTCGQFRYERIKRLMCESPIDCTTEQAATSASKEVYFGEYPQTMVNETSLGLMGKNHEYVKVERTEENSVTYGGKTYYWGTDGELYYYTTVEACENIYNFSNGISVISGQNCYFRVEPIRWIVQTNNYVYDANGSTASLLIAAEVLDSGVEYYDYSSDDEKRTVGSKNDIRPSHYEYSNIRAWLNGLQFYEYIGATHQNILINRYYNTETGKGTGFLQTAFSESAQNLINTTLVKNDANSTTDSLEQLHKADGTLSGYSLLSNDTNDKIFLLSLQEITTEEYGFKTLNIDDISQNYDTARKRVPTDFAISSGVYIVDYGYRNAGANWILRTPYYYNYIYVYFVRNDGYPVKNVFANTKETNRGILPAITINLQ